MTPKSLLPSDSEVLTKWRMTHTHRWKRERELEEKIESDKLKRTKSVLTAQQIVGITSNINTVRAFSLCINARRLFHQEFHPAKNKNTHTPLDTNIYIYLPK